MKDTVEAILEGLELAGIEEVNTAGIKVEAGSLSRFDEAVDVSLGLVFSVGLLTQ